MKKPDGSKKEHSKKTKEPTLKVDSKEFIKAMFEEYAICLDLARRCHKGLKSFVFDIDLESELYQLHKDLKKHFK